MGCGILTPRWIWIRNFGFSGLFGHICETDDGGTVIISEACLKDGYTIFDGPYRHATLVLVFLSAASFVISLACGVLTQCWLKHRFFTVTFALNLIATSFGYLGTHTFCEHFSIGAEGNPDVINIAPKWSDIYFEYGYFLYLGGVNLGLIGGLASGLIYFIE
ncbi:unnamed protein product [Bursaphelenchus xylophilus]|uniref:(pine wood nematode) hypothetical protein n=1 Tax=Bursaphelenchus xylophilus TaxID=6326 RepID=A0A1I7SV36_BURXY|nr:unnamed protein product [Bursaphelenchus xylophilus]CAG9100847.1 unnamed protein product [Bursaphelenchus xylophilus]